MRLDRWSGQVRVHQTLPPPGSMLGVDRNPLALGLIFVHPIAYHFSVTAPLLIPPFLPSNGSHKESQKAQK